MHVLNKLDLDRRKKEAEKKARDLKIQEEENRKRNEQSKEQEKVFDRLKKLEPKDIPLSQNFNIVNKIFVPVLKSTLIGSRITFCFLNKK